LFFRGESEPASARRLTRKTQKFKGEARRPIESEGEGKAIRERVDKGSSRKDHSSRIRKTMGGDAKGRGLVKIERCSSSTGRGRKRSRSYPSFEDIRGIWGAK